MKTTEKIGEGYKAGVGRFKVYLVGHMQYEVREGHNGPVVDTKPNLSDAFSCARRFNEMSKAA